MENVEVKSNLLIVDDDEGVCTSLREILRAKFNVLVANSAKIALEIIRHNSNGDICSIDLVISDICMGQVDGIELLRRIKQKNSKVEVIMVTGYPNSENTLNALKFGASDYIVKPFKIPEVLDSIDKVMDRKRESSRLEKMVEELRRAIAKNYSATTDALIMAIDAKDNYTKEHCSRVAELMVEFSKELGLGEDETELYRKVSVLHDIGKIGMREDILRKAGRLTDEEMEEVKRHPFIGYQIVQSVDFLSEAKDVILYHQERYDGTGYPAGLKDKQIPLGARMLAIVDSYDAMSTDRPYRKKMEWPKVYSELRNGSGTQFDPGLVKTFINMINNKSGANAS